jgi:hypothetical protein
MSFEHVDRFLSTTRMVRHPRTNFLEKRCEKQDITYSPKSWGCSFTESFTLDDQFTFPMGELSVVVNLSYIERYISIKMKFRVFHLVLLVFPFGQVIATMDFTFVPSEFDALLLLGLENHRKQCSVVLVNHFVAVRVASVD